MGYVRHNAIVVTSYDESLLNAAAQKAHDLGMIFMGPSAEGVNCYRSLLVCPDGSKEGWHDSDDGDERRKAFREWLDNRRFSDGSSCLEWVEVAYGNDGPEAEVVVDGTESGHLIGDGS